MSLIQLRTCTVQFTDWGCITKFPDGSEVSAWPHFDDHHYHVIAHRLGYRFDLSRYCQEHEFSHSFLSERIRGTRSHVLWALAHDLTPDPGEALYEEIAAQTFQRLLRANEEPILSGVDWGALKQEALKLLCTSSSLSCSSSSSLVAATTPVPVLGTTAVAGSG